MTKVHQSISKISDFDAWDADIKAKFRNLNYQVDLCVKCEAFDNLM